MVMKSSILMSALTFASLAHADPKSQFVKVLECTSTSGTAMSLQIYQQMGEGDEIGAFMSVKTKESGDIGALGSLSIQELATPVGGTAYSYVVNTEAITGYGAVQKASLIVFAKAYDSNGKVDDTFSKTGSISIVTPVTDQLSSTVTANVKCDILL